MMMFRFQAQIPVAIAVVMSLWLATGQAISQDTPPSASPLKNTSITMNDNPLLKPSSLPYTTPDFAAVQPDLFEPAFEAGMAEQLKEIQVIAEQSKPATFDNTLVEMERSGTTLRSPMPQPRS